MTAAISTQRSTQPRCRPLHVRLLAALLSASIALPAPAATALADQPLFANAGVPGNLALPLSVEYPTAVSVAHRDGTYVPATSYLGYFDPDKCYAFTFVDVETATLKSHFAPAGAATNHTCTGTNDWKWSGNFLNWSTMQTVDPFRWALTGGYRVVDTASLTLIEKAWASGQGGLANFPNRVVALGGTTIADATPFRGTVAWTMQIAGQGQMMAITADGAVSGGMLGTYFNSNDLSGNPVLTRFEIVDFNWLALSPFPGVVNADNFSARWTSLGTAPSPGTYNFRTVSDDGVRLWVNGVKVIDNWTDHASTTDTSSNIVLNAGDPISVRLEYYEKGGSAEMRLQWKAPGALVYTPYAPDTANRLPVRVKVCDPAAAAGGLEDNCQAYANGNYKPEGLMQQYANRIRYSVFGYLNDSNIQRDGGVLRAKQKFVGPTFPTPGLPDATNAAREWEASTGVYIGNPDDTDAADTATVFGTPISNSGVLNYLNKFGEISRSGYKTYDPVSELYYAAIRYFKNQGNVTAWSDMTGASPATKATWADGFPVITAWNDPIQYSCQRNFILGIGDTNSHADKNVPGPTGTANEPTKPGPAGGLMGDSTFSSSINAVTATNKVGSMQGLGASLGTVENYNGCCNNNSTLMAGLAYDANTRDIRPDLPNPANSIGQTVQTFWVDVLESGFATNNQFYLAAKYGGFKVPTTFDPYSAGAALQDSWWYTTTDTVGSQPRPDNYFTAGRPDQLVDGLTKAFASIAAQLKAYTTSFSTALPQVSSSGNASFSAQYDAQYWTGEIIASTLTFAAATGEPTASENWRFSDKLEAQAATAGVVNGWDTARFITTWNPTSAIGVPLRYAQLTTGQKAALNTSYRSGDDGADYLNYLRGDRSLEKGTAAATSTNPYRGRARLLGDIVGSKARPVGAPNMPFSNAANPGYTAFKSAKSTRQTVVYVGANDGMLHAINGALTGSGAGNELFAFMPNALLNGPTTPAASTNASIDGLGALGKPTFTHHNYVNATPNVYDIDFAKTSGGSGAANWKSVLIGGLGKGGKSYYAIDVTDPSTMTTEATVAAKVLWEFTDADLGFTYGEPVVVKTKKYGWVVIFGSGYNNGGTGTFFIVNPRTGALLEKRSTGVGGGSTDAGLAFVNAYVLDRSDGTADAAYAGDLLGNVWRLDLTATSGNYPVPTQIAQLADSGGAVQPVTSRPLIEVQPNTNKRYVLVGTGRALDSTDIASTQGQTFYALQDGSGTRFNAAANLPSGVSFPLRRANLVANTNPLVGVTLGATSMGWFLELGNGTGSIGWRVISDPTTYYGTVAFAATLPNGSACSPSGSSRIYALDFGSGVSALTTTSSTTTGGVTTTTTTTIAYNDAVSGVVTDLKYFSVGGVPRLIAGSDTGGLKTIEGRFGQTVSLRRLNWRELPLAD